MNLHHDLGYSLFIICCLHISYIWIWHGKSIYIDLKGDNKRWDAPELLILFCIVIWAPILLADAFFGFHPSEHVWMSLEVVIGFALAGKVGLKWVAAKQTPVNETRTTIEKEKKTDIPAHEKPEGE
jgi:hypothetical protein